MLIWGRPGVEAGSRQSQMAPGRADSQVISLLLNWTCQRDFEHTAHFTSFLRSKFKNYNRFLSCQRLSFSVRRHWFQRRGLVARREWKGNPLARGLPTEQPLWSCYGNRHNRNKTEAQSLGNRSPRSDTTVHIREPLGESPCEEAGVSQ